MTHQKRRRPLKHAEAKSAVKPQVRDGYFLGVRLTTREDVKRHTYAATDRDTSDTPSRA